jgi:DNA-binding NarL/FixJ family response regulator
MKKITVLIVEDHVMVREGLSKMLDLEDDFNVVAEAKDGRQAVELALKHLPDVILMDIAMPLMNGLEATRQLLKALPASRVVILSAHNDDAYVQSAIDSGAVGFLLKQNSGQDVCRAIREVFSGKRYFNSSVMKRRDRLQAAAVNRAGLHRPRAAILTSRETEVLQLIAEGKSNKESAAALNISLKTIEKHREHLMQKLDIHDTAGLTRYAISTGIIESSVQLTIL